MCRGNVEFSGEVGEGMESKKSMNELHNKVIEPPKVMTREQYEWLFVQMVLNQKYERCIIIAKKPTE